MAHVTLVDMIAAEAKKVFLKNDSYINFDLPNYFSFGPLLNGISSQMEGSDWSKFQGIVLDDEGKPKTAKDGSEIRKNPGYQFGVNHRIVVNKNSNLSWRPLELTHPVLYVALAHLFTDEANWKILTECFSSFRRDTIEVASIPPGKSFDKKTNKAEQIKKWWDKSEQRSVELGLEYSYISETDISDCYSSMYTHSVAWAIHGRDEAFKQQRNKELLGNKVDDILMAMHHRQTNGIPQGSVMYDFIAELVLGYIDTLLYDKIDKENIKEYKIIRFRDDYKIFTKSQVDGKRILRVISDLLVDFGLRLNANKTVSGRSLIDASFKADKLEGLFIPKIENNYAKHLMQIHQFSEKYPNSGQVSRMLNMLHDDMFNKLGGGIIKGLKEFEKPKVMISILVDMCTKNPRFYNIIAAIISLLLSQLSDADKIVTAKAVHDRLQSLPNTGLLDLWLQRAVYKYDQSLEFKEPLARVPVLHGGNPIGIWNNEWLNQDAINLITSTPIVDTQLYASNSAVTTRDEVDEFRDIPS